MSDLFTATTAAQVEEALARGEDIEREQGFPVTTPLISACKRGELEVVDCLLNHGANVAHTPSGSESPIQWSAKNGHAAIVERLVRAGANINDNQGGEGWTTLAFASVEGHVDVVDCLSSLGADIEMRDVFGNTALMWASWKGRIDVVDRLLAAGANLNTR